MDIPTSEVTPLNNNGKNRREANNPSDIISLVSRKILVLVFLITVLSVYYFISFSSTSPSAAVVPSLILMSPPEPSSSSGNNNYMSLYDWDCTNCDQRLCGKCPATNCGPPRYSQWTAAYGGNSGGQAVDYAVPYWGGNPDPAGGAPIQKKSAPSSQKTTRHHEVITDFQEVVSMISVNADSGGVKGIMYQNDKFGQFEFGDHTIADYEETFVPDICNGEYITEITIGYGCVVNSLQFKTNAGRESSKFGGGRGGLEETAAAGKEEDDDEEEETVTAPEGYVLGALRVREDSSTIYQIQFLWTKNPHQDTNNNNNMVLSNIYHTPYCVWDDPDTIRDDKKVIEGNNVFSSDGCDDFECGTSCPSSYSTPTSFDKDDIWSDLYGSSSSNYEDAAADYTVYPWFLRCAAWKVSVLSSAESIDAIGFQVDRIGSLWYGDFVGRSKDVETFELDTCNGEFITEVTLSYGCSSGVNSLQFKTNTGNASSKFGGDGEEGSATNEDTVTAPTGYVLGGMRVRAAAKRISQIQFLWVPNPSSNDRCVSFDVPYTPMCGYDGVEINYLVKPP